MSRAAQRAGAVSCCGMAAALAWFALSGCAVGRRNESALPVRNSIVRDQLVLHCDTSLPAHHRLFDDLAAQRGDVARTLALPTSDEPIHVYLFDSAAGFEDFMRLTYPRLPLRRAFFVESDTRLTVYAHWGDRVAEDLRHEVAHGYLHAAMRNIPLWLDEGLAEYFEVPRGTAGLNPPHVQDLAGRLAAGGWRPDLARLESLRSIGEMDQLDYAESWAWVHFLLETTPPRRALIQAQLAALRREGAAEALSAQVRRNIPQAERELAEHLYRLATAQ